MKGYELVNDVFGILSVFTSNYMYTYNAFTWLTIALSCDFSVGKQSLALTESESVLSSTIMTAPEKLQVRRRIHYT